MKATPDQHRAAQRLYREDVEAVDWYDMETHARVKSWVSTIVAFGVGIAILTVAILTAMVLVIGLVTLIEWVF